MSDEVEVVMEEAGPGDYQAVLAVSEGVYGGLDYLPAQYKAWLQEAQARPQQRYNFMLVVRHNSGDREMVGFFSLLFSWDGSTFLSSAQRVAPAWQGRGLGRKITDFVQQVKWIKLYI